MHYITDDRNQQVALNNKKHIGVKQKEASYCIDMNLYKKHFFIEETTSVSCYYLKHIEQEDEKNFTKEYDI